MNRYQQAFAKIYTHNFAAHKGESLLLIADCEPFAGNVMSRDELVHLAEAAAQTAELQVATCSYEATGSHGNEPPAKVWEKVFGDAFAGLPAEIRTRLLTKQADSTDESLLENRWRELGIPRVDILLILSHYSLSHTRFRSLANRVTGVRIATMPTFIPKQLVGVMSADWPEVARKSRQAALLLSEAQSVSILSDDRLELTMSVAGRSGLADTGLLTEPGVFGNLPGGEGFVAPVEGSAQGQFEAYTADGASRMVFTVEDGLFRTVSRSEDPSVQKLVELLATSPEVANLAELGIGTNEKALDTANILEGEKILGTCHIAFGDNKGFGGIVSAPFHRDYIIPEPTLVFSFANRSPVTLIERGIWRI